MSILLLRLIQSLSNLSILTPPQLGYQKTDYSGPRTKDTSTPKIAPPCPSLGQQTLLPASDPHGAAPPSLLPASPSAPVNSSAAVKPFSVFTQGKPVQSSFTLGKRGKEIDLTKNKFKVSLSPDIHPKGNADGQVKYLKYKQKYLELKQSIQFINNN